MKHEKRWCIMYGNLAKLYNSLIANKPTSEPFSILRKKNGEIKWFKNYTKLQKGLAETDAEAFVKQITVDENGEEICMPEYYTKSMILETDEGNERLADKKNKKQGKTHKKKGRKKYKKIMKELRDISKYFDIAVMVNDNLPQKSTDKHEMRVVNSYGDIDIQYTNHSFYVEFINSICSSIVTTINGEKRTVAEFGGYLEASEKLAKLNEAYNNGEKIFKF